MALPVQITVDCADPARLAEFWATVLGYHVTWNGEGQSLITDPDDAGPRLLFNRVPEGKTAKNRLHLDVIASGMGTPKDASRPLVEAAVARVTALGATYTETFDKENDYYVVMRDPEGNEFCIG